MDLRLDGKNALVCGSSKGLGKAIAMQFAEMGANVTLVSRNEELLQKAVVELDKNGNQSHDYIAVDFSEPENVLAKVKEKMSGGKIYHVLVNNSGGPAPGPVFDAKPEDFLKAVKMHLITSQLLVKELVPGMKETGCGRILNVISISVKQPIDNLGVSNTTRGAMASWSKTLSRELAPYGITVNNLLPGQTKTERLDNLIANNAKEKGITVEEMQQQMLRLIPMGRFGKPEELGYAAGFLASDKAAFITGLSLHVDGGFVRGI